MHRKIAPTASAAVAFHKLYTLLLLDLSIRLRPVRTKVRSEVVASTVHTRTREHSQMHTHTFFRRKTNLTRTAFVSYQIGSFARLPPACSYLTSTGVMEQTFLSRVLRKAVLTIRGPYGQLHSACRILNLKAVDGPRIIQVS